MWNNFTSVVALDRKKSNMKSQNIVIVVKSEFYVCAHTQVCLKNHNWGWKTKGHDQRNQMPKHLMGKMVFATSWIAAEI